MGDVPKLNQPIFVALDVDTEASALSLAEKVSHYVGGYKIGPRLTYKYGSSIVQRLSKLGLVFVDNKYHDIPSTVVAAIRATFESGASFATVHASNGRETLVKLAELEKELNTERPFKILSVTALTSFSESSVPSNWLKQSLMNHVNMLATEVIDAGLSGIVCSPIEVSELRKKYKQSFLVTPGIRMPTDEMGDQSRVLAPKEAILAGSSALVIGRPIVEAVDPAVMARQISRSIE